MQRLDTEQARWADRLAYALSPYGFRTPRDREPLHFLVLGAMRSLRVPNAHAHTRVRP